jgi:predicted DCC family thiol-disulfide oxidoreductase YuxK
VTMPALDAVVQAPQSSLHDAVAPAAAALPDGPVLFFDGVCGFCNGWVDFFLSRDRTGSLKFAPLQGTTAAQLVRADDIAALKSLVLWTPAGVFRSTAAVVRVFWLLGGVWSVCGTLIWLIPGPLRELGYRIIAANRYRIAGKKETCRMPTPAERARFLP